MPSLRKKWPEPELSCGSQITTTRLGRARSVWWAHGPALERFEKDIEPRIGAALMNVELGYSEIYYRLYMIGKRAELSKPIVMICCTDPQIRSNVESSIRQCGVLEDHPEFGLGACALPFEQPTPARPLGGQAGVLTATTDDGGAFGLRKRSFAGAAAADTEDPGAPLGLKITTFDATGQYRTTTGGVVVKAGSTYYQMTVKHAASELAIPGLEPNYSASDLEEVHFDGQSDDDADEDEVDGDEDEETMTRGSLTPVDSLTTKTSWTEFVNVDSHSSGTQGSFNTDRSNPWLQLTTPTYPLIRHQSDLRRRREDQGKTRFVPPPGLEPMFCGDGSGPGLNYVLVPLVGQPKGVNEVQLRKSRSQPTLSIQALAEIPARPRRIVAVTRSSGVDFGSIRPGATYLRTANSSALQKLYAVHLDSAVFEGDCGSAVIDQETGGLYGHIVRGCPRTGTAYIVSAGEIFRDIKDRFGAGVVSIAPSNRPRVASKPGTK